MVRRSLTVTPRSHTPRSGALRLGAVVVALALFGGCIGGAQPVPPALELDPTYAADAGAASDASRGFFDDAGPRASDAASPPRENDNLADFAGEQRATPNGVDPATDNGWRWYPFPPLHFLDAGALVADDLGPGDESVDAH